MAGSWGGDRRRAAAPGREGEGGRRGVPLKVVDWEEEEQRESLVKGKVAIAIARSRELQDMVPNRPRRRRRRGRRRKKKKEEEEEDALLLPLLSGFTPPGGQNRIYTVAYGPAPSILLMVQQPRI
jgi:hypothetical protein